MTTYDFICNHLENDYPDTIPVMDEYLMAWLEDDEDTTEGVAGDLKGVIYPYLAALRALTDAGVEGTEKYIVELRIEEVGSRVLAFSVFLCLRRSRYRGMEPFAVAREKSFQRGIPGLERRKTRHRSS